MIHIQLISDNKIEIIVDTDIYSDTIISKVLYWLADRFIITREKMGGGSKQRIILEKMDGYFTKQEYDAFRLKLSRDMIDYKNREIIHEETKDIRSILYVKAFAHSDDLVEMDFQ